MVGLDPVVELDLVVGLLDYGKSHNHDYFGHHDYSIICEFENMLGYSALQKSKKVK